MNTGYFEKTKVQYQQLRDKLYASLEKVGLQPMKPDGGYFIVAKIDPTSVKEDYSTFLTKEVGVTCIPLRAFYQKDDALKVEQFVRFAFCKDEDTLKEGSSRLEKYFLK